MSVEWGKLFGLSVPAQQLVVRGTAMYFFLYLLFRVVIKRRVGAIGMADMLVLVIVDGQVTVIKRQARAASGP